MESIRWLEMCAPAGQVAPRGTPEALCLSCHGPLAVRRPDRRRPDRRRPDRLLGTCPTCGAWHILDRRARGPAVSVEVLLLPGPGRLRDALPGVTSRPSPIAVAVG